jgi:Glycosyl hydrolases family 16
VRHGILLAPTRKVVLDHSIPPIASYPQSRNAIRRQMIARKRTVALLAGLILLAILPCIGMWAHATNTRQRTIDINDWRETFSDDFRAPADITPYGPSKWIAHTPWYGDFGDAKFTDPIPGFPFRFGKSGLVIQAKRDSNGKWMSGLLCSFDPNGNGFRQALGYFEISAKLPDGPGVWPAFWLASGRSPDRGAEIDVLEYYGHASSSYQVALHVWPARADDQINLHIAHPVDVPANSLTQGFHTFGVSIDREWVVFFLDRIEVHREPSRPEFQQPLGILINLALGSGWPIDHTPDPSHYEIAYVKAFISKR